MTGWGLGAGGSGLSVRRNFARAAAFSLLLLPGTMAAQQKVPLVLNHLVIALDSATWSDVSASGFLREQFAAADSGCLSGFDYGPGVRLFGKYNYLTLSPVSALPGVTRPAGFVDIVLGSESPGGLDRLKQQGEFSDGGKVVQVDARCVSANEYTDRGAVLDRPAGADSTSGQTGFGVMQYTVKWARELVQSDSLPEANLSNVRFLASSYNSKRLLSYLSGATLAIPVADIARIVAVLKRNGVTLFSEGEGAIIKLDGFTLHLIPPWSGPGVKQLQFALTRDVPANPVYTFGPRSRLRFGPGPIAVWDFDTR